MQYINSYHTYWGGRYYRIRGGVLEGVCVGGGIRVCVGRGLHKTFKRSLEMQKFQL